MAIDLKSILNYVSPAPTYLGKLEEAGTIKSEDLDALRNRSLVQGLLTAGLGYLAQPKTGRYGSALPYLGKAGLMGLQAMQQPYEQFGKDLELGQKIENLNLERSSRNKTKEFVTEMVNSGDPRWANLDKLGPNEQATAVQQYLQEKFKSPTKTAPKQRKREVVKNGELYNVTEEWVGGQWTQVDEPTPKEMDTDIPFTDEAIELAASGFIVDGKLPPMGRGKSATEDRRRIINRATEIIQEQGGNVQDARKNAILNLQEFKSQEIALKNFSTGVEGRKVRSLNTAMAHLESMKQWSEALKNKDVRKVNVVANELAKEFGNENVTNFNFAKQIVADEVLTSVVQAGGSMQERQELQESFNAANTPEQLMGVIETAHELMAGQLQSLELQYKSSVGDDLAERNPFVNKLSPSTKDLYSKLTKGSSKMTKQISKADQDALDWYNSAPDSVTKTEVGKKLRAKGLEID